MVPKEEILPLIEIYSFIHLVSLAAKYSRNAFASDICRVELYYSI